MTTIAYLRQELGKFSENGGFIKEYMGLDSNAKKSLNEMAAAEMTLLGIEVSASQM